MDVHDEIKEQYVRSKYITRRLALHRRTCGEVILSMIQVQGIQLNCGHEKRYIAKANETNCTFFESSIPLTNVMCDSKVSRSASHLRVFFLDEQIWTSLGLLSNTCKCEFHSNHKDSKMLESNISVKPNRLNFNQLWCDSDGVANSSVVSLPATNLKRYHSEEELILYRTDDTSSFKGTTVFVHNNESVQYTCSVSSNGIINLTVSATPEDLELRNSNGEETNSNVIILSVTLSFAVITGCVIIIILLRRRCACRNGHPPWCSQRSLNNHSNERTDGDPTTLLRRDLVKN